MFDQQPFNVKQTVGSAWNVDRDDVMKTKTALQRTGDYKPPRWGITAFPDAGMFEGLRSFQTREGLEADGVMKPGGPTEERLQARMSSEEHSPAPRNASIQSPQPSMPPKSGAAAPDIMPDEWEWQRNPGQQNLGTGPDRPIDLGPDDPILGKKQRDRSGDTQTAFAPLVPLIATAAPLAMRYGPKALQGLQRLMMSAPPAIIGAEIARHGVEKNMNRRGASPSPTPMPTDRDAEDRTRSNRVRVDPPPPTPGYEPPDEKLPDHEEFPDQSNIARTPNVPPASLKVDTFTESYPIDESLRLPMILESRGNKDTKRKNIAVVELAHEIATDENFLLEHEKGAETVLGEFRKERLYRGFVDEDGNYVKGARPDVSFLVERDDGESVRVEVQTADANADNITLKPREIDANDRILVHIKVQGKKGFVLAYPKIPGMPPEKWKEHVRENFQKDLLDIVRNVER